MDQDFWVKSLVIRGCLLGDTSEWEGIGPADGGLVAGGQEGTAPAGQSGLQG